MNSKNDRKSIRWIVAAALAVVLCVCICFGVACKSKTNEDAVGEGTYFTKTDPGKTKPEEGYSGNEYVNYVAYVLEQQTEWYAVSDSQAKASVNNQQIWTDKYYKDGYMLTTQKSYSTFSKEAFEALFVTGRQGSAGEERGVYLRDGDKPKDKDHDFSGYKWDDGEPTYYLEEDYYFLHGLFSDEMSVFLINDQTIEKADAVVKNSDGTYSQHFVLDTDDSVYYYQYSMKNHGGLASFPAFSKVEVTMTFNEAFELLKLETSEQSTVRKAGSNWQNKTEAVTTYTYPGMKEAENFNGDDFETIWSDNQKTLDEAKDYFDKYYNKIEASTDREIVYTPDASDVLMGALGDALTSEGETYRMYVNYNDGEDAVDASGYVYLAVDLESWEDLTFDFSDFSTMDWVTFALEAYQYAHIIVEVDGDDGEQALIVDLLSGSNILEILAGKLIEVYIGEGALASGLTEEEITSGVNDLTVRAFTAIANALTDESAVEDSGDVDMSLEYGPLGRLATVTLDMDAFYMSLDCYELWTFSGGETIYEYELIQATIEIPSIGLSIVLTPVTGDKMSYVTPDETVSETGATVGSMGLETLVMDLINSVLNLSSSSYINESYTFSGDIDIDIISIADIKIDNAVITIGDILDDFYISFVGDLQGSTLFTMAVAEESTIGFTWCGDYIVLAKDLETATPTYRVYTTDSFVDTMLDSDTNVSPIAWLLGTNSLVWATVTALFDLTSLSATALGDVQTIESDGTSEAQNLFDRLNIGYYVSAMEVKLDEELGASYGDMDVESMFGLTDDYWAFVLGDEFIDDVTGGILTNAAIALTQNMSQLGGIYVTGTIFSVLDLALSLNYEPNATTAYEDLFGGNLVLAITEDQTVTDEEGNTTTETVTVGINAQLVPNLYYVFMESMAGYGASAEDLSGEDVKNKEMTILYTYIIFTYEGSATTDGTFAYYEYTVGDNSYKAYYYHEAVTGTDKDGGSKNFDAGYGYIEYELEDYTSDDSGENDD